MLPRSHRSRDWIAHRKNTSSQVLLHNLSGYFLSSSYSCSTWQISLFFLLSRIMVDWFLNDIHVFDHVLAGSASIMILAETALWWRLDLILYGQVAYILNYHFVIDYLIMLVYVVFSQFVLCGFQWYVLMLLLWLN